MDEVGEFLRALRPFLFIGRQSFTPRNAMLVLDTGHISSKRRDPHHNGFNVALCATAGHWLTVLGVHRPTEHWTMVGPGTVLSHTMGTQGCCMCCTWGRMRAVPMRARPSVHRPQSPGPLFFWQGCIVRVRPHIRSPKGRERDASCGTGTALRAGGMQPSANTAQASDGSGLNEMKAAHSPPSVEHVPVNVPHNADAPGATARAHVPYFLDLVTGTSAFHPLVVTCFVYILMIAFYAIFNLAFVSSSLRMTRASFGATPDADALIGRPFRPFKVHVSDEGSGPVPDVTVTATILPVGDFRVEVEVNGQVPPPHPAAPSSGVGREPGPIDQTRPNPIGGAPTP